MPVSQTSLVVIPRSRKHKALAPKVRKVLLAILKELGLKKVALNFLLTDDLEITQLNRHFLNHRGATDVMAFPLEPYATKRGGKAGCDLAGDVVVSLETIARQAKEYQTTFFYELAFCLCHGLLHLKGYDDLNARAAQRMWRKQTELLKVVGVVNAPAGLRRKR